MIEQREGGFTIVELMIATVIFSLVLMGAMAGLVQVGRLYYRGITFARTQEAARNVVDEVSHAIQFSKKNVLLSDILISGPQIPLASNDTAFFCVGPIRYSYTIDRKLTLGFDLAKKEKEHVLWVDEPVGGCAEATSPVAADLASVNPCSDGSCKNGRELLSENMRISRFNVIDNFDHTYSINLSLAYGDDDLLSNIDNRLVCENSSISVQFCAISELSSTVLRRVQ